MSILPNHFSRLSRFLKTDVWRDNDEAEPLIRFFFQAVRVLLLTLHGLKNRMVLLRAAALSYSTLLAIVPLLAIIVSMLKGLGFHERLEQFLIHSLAAEHQDLISRIIGYIADTDFKALGAFGTAVLIYASVNMISNVERTFNELWGAPRNRSVSRKISNYISLLFLGPLFMMLSTAFITVLTSSTLVTALTEFHLFERFSVVFSRMASHGALWLAFTAMYILLPNTKVRFFPGLIAGVVCGSLWESAFRAYMNLNINVAHYNTIYGTFAALPVFITWLYMSWIIVLMGAQLSFAVQNVRTLGPETVSPDTDAGPTEEMALYVMFHICRRFHHGLAPLSVNALADLTAATPGQVREIVRRLGKAQLVGEILGGEEILVAPLKNIGLIRPLDVCLAFREQEPWRPPDTRENRPIKRLLREKVSAEADRLASMNFSDLAAAGEAHVAA